MLLTVVLSVGPLAVDFCTQQSPISNVGLSSQPTLLPFLHPHGVPELSAALGSAGFLLAHPLSHIPQIFLKYLRATPCLAPCWIQNLPMWLGIVHWNIWETMIPRIPQLFRVFLLPLTDPEARLQPSGEVTIILSDLFALLSCFSLSCGVGSCHSQIVRTCNTIEVFTKSVLNLGYTLEQCGKH